MEEYNKNINKKPNKLIQEKVLISLLKSYGYLDTYNYLSVLNVNSNANNIRRIYADLKRQNPGHIKINIIKGGRKRFMIIANIPKSAINSDEILNKYISEHRIYHNEYNYTIVGKNIRYLHRFIKDNKSSDIRYKMTSKRNKKGRPAAIEEVKILLAIHYKKVEGKEREEAYKNYNREKEDCYRDEDDDVCDTSLRSITIFNSRHYIKEYVSNDLNEILKLFIYRNYDRQGVFHEILSKTRRFLWKRYKDYTVKGKEFFSDFKEVAKKHMKKIGHEICTKRKIRWFMRERILSKAYIKMKLRQKMNKIKNMKRLINLNAFPQRPGISETVYLSENNFPTSETMYMGLESTCYNNSFLNRDLIDLFRSGYHSDIQIKVNQIKSKKLTPQDLIDYAKAEYNTHASNLINYNKDFYHTFKIIVCKELSIFKFKVKEAYNNVYSSQVEYIKDYCRNNAIYKIKMFIKDNKVLNKLEKEEKKLKLK